MSPMNCPVETHSYDRATTLSFKVKLCIEFQLKPECTIVGRQKYFEGLCIKKD